MASPAKPKVDPHSDTWRALLAFVEPELARLRTALEQPGLDVAVTENIRGQIMALNGVLSLTQSRPAPVAGYTQRYD